MKLLSAPVLGGAALVSSPALWNAFDGATSASLALTRYLVSVVLCWLALGALVTVVGPPPKPEPVAAEAEGAQGHAPQPESSG